MESSRCDLHHQVKNCTDPHGYRSITLQESGAQGYGDLKIPVQCTLHISRLVGPKHWYRDLSGSAIYQASVMSQN